MSSTYVQTTPVGPRGLAGRFLILGGVFLALGIACGASQEVEPAAAKAEPVVVEANPKAESEAIALPSSPSTYADELAALDQRIAAIRQRARTTVPSWLTLQTLAGALSERAHLSGDYDDYGAAEATLAEAFELAAEGSGPLMTRARLHFTLHRIDPALADLESAAKRINLKDYEQAALDGLRADIAFQRGDYAEALATFEKQATAKPSLGTLSRLAKYRWKTGDFDGADALFVEALAAYKGTSAQPRAWLRLMRGLLDLDRGRHRQAYAHYQNAAAEFSGYWLVDEHIAEIRGILGETAAAKTLYVDLIERTDNPEFMDALADILEEGGDKEGAKTLRLRAKSAYESLLQRYPEAAAGHAIAHYLDDPSDEAKAQALELAKANHRLRPNGAAQILLARALLGVGEIERAKATVATALAGPWRSAGLHEVASAVFAAAGDSTRADAELAKARAIDPTIGD